MISTDLTAIWAVVASIVIAAIGVIGYWRGSQAKTALATYRESNDAYRDRIDQLREDVDILKAENLELKAEIRNIKELPLADIKSGQDAIMKSLDQVQTTQTELLKILAAQSTKQELHVHTDQLASQGN